MSYKPFLPSTSKQPLKPNNPQHSNYIISKLHNVFYCRNYDGGNNKFSAPKLGGVALAVVGVFEHLEETKNRFIHVHEAVLSCSLLIVMAKRRDPAVCNLPQASSDENVANSYAAFARGNLESRRF